MTPALSPSETRPVPAARRRRAACAYSSTLRSGCLAGSEVPPGGRLRRPRSPADCRWRRRLSRHATPTGLSQPPGTQRVSRTNLGAAPKIPALSSDLSPCRPGKRIRIEEMKGCLALSASSPGLGPGPHVVRRTPRADSPWQCAVTAPFLSGCESRPATVAPAGSNRSGRWRQRYRPKHSDDKGRRGRFSDHAGRNATERRAGPETCDAEADPPATRGRLPAVGKRATGAPTVSAGVLATARMEEGNGRNTGSPAGGVARANRQPARVRLGRRGWRRGL